MTVGLIRTANHLITVVLILAYVCQNLMINRPILANLVEFVSPVSLQTNSNTHGLPNLSFCLKKTLIDAPTRAKISAARLPLVRTLRTAISADVCLVM